MADLRMPDVNRVLLAGRLTSDPELKYLPSGTPVCEMRLAADRRYKTRDGEQREETLFVNVKVWARTAEICGEHLSKGRPILIEGRLNSDSWEDKNTGQKRSKIEIVADRVQFLDWEDRGGGGGGGGRQGGYSGGQGSGGHGSGGQGSGGQRSGGGRGDDYQSEPVPDDDIPF
jgi:single-strand DNA-binding protein